MNKKSVSLVSVAFALIFSVPAFADTVYKSAMFNFSEQQLIDTLQESQDLNIGSSGSVLYCQSDIDPQGVAKVTRCYDKQNSDSLVSATEQAMAELAFTPASVDDKTVPVRMSYRVGLNEIDGKIHAALIPNLGSMHERYGRDYVAPQERLDVSDWYDRYNRNSWVNGEAFLGHGPLSRVAATVDQNGKTDVVRELDNQRAYRRDTKIVKNALKKSRFIPGFVDGRPVPMGYLAVINYGGESGEAVSSR